MSEDIPVVALVKSCTWAFDGYVLAPCLLLALCRLYCVLCAMCICCVLRMLRVRCAARVVCCVCCCVLNLRCVLVVSLSCVAGCVLLLFTFEFSDRFLICPCGHLRSLRGIKGYRRCMVGGGILLWLLAAPGMARALPTRFLHVLWGLSVGFWAKVASSVARHVLCGIEPYACGE